MASCWAGRGGAGRSGALRDSGQGLAEPSGETAIMETAWDYAGALFR